MAVQTSDLRRFAARLVGLIPGLVLLASCVPLSIPAALQESGKSVAVVCMVGELVTVTRVLPFGAPELATLDMDGLIRKTVNQAFASQVAANHPNWTIRHLNYDRDFDNTRLYKVKSASAFGYEETRKEVAAFMQKHGLDAAFLVFETAWEGLETRYPGIGAILVGVPGYLGGASTVSRLDVHSSLLIVGVDAQGNIISRGDLTGLIGAKTFDKTQDRFSFNVAENLQPPRVELVRKAVVSSVAEVLTIQFKRMGV